MKAVSDYKLTLMHVLADCIEKQFPHLAEFDEQLQCIDLAAQGKFFKTFLFLKLCLSVILVDFDSIKADVRELENTIHRAVLLSSGTVIDVSDLFDEITQESLKVTVKSDIEKSLLIGRTVASVEKDLILNTLDHCSGNRTHAAHILGISIRTLRNKLKEYGDAPQDVMAG